MKARKDCKTEHSYIDRRQIIAGVVGDTGCEHYRPDGDNLNCSVDLSQPGWAETPEPGHDIYCGCSNNNKDVSADHGDGYPKGHRQVAWYRWRENAPH